MLSFALPLFFVIPGRAEGAGCAAPRNDSDYGAKPCAS